MAFHIETKTGQVFIWHINNHSKPKNRRRSEFNPFVTKVEDIKDIVFLQADGDELEYIRNRIQNIPIGFSIFKWRDHYAQLIYDNL